MREERANEALDAYYGGAPDWTPPKPRRSTKKDRGSNGQATSGLDSKKTNGRSGLDRRDSPIVHLVRTDERAEPTEPMGLI